MRFERESFNRTIRNDAGDIVPNAQITVYSSSGGLATIYGSLAGGSKSNPFNADAGGKAEFYAKPGRYDVHVFKGGNVAILKDVDLSQKALREDLSGPDSNVSISGRPAREVAALRDDLADPLEDVPIVDSNGDSVVDLRKDLSEKNVEGIVFNLPNIKDLADAPKIAGAQYSASSYSSDFASDGGLYQYDPDADKSLNDGRTIIAPEAISEWSGLRSDLATLVNWSESGSGAFVLIGRYKSAAHSNKIEFFERHKNQFRIVSHRGTQWGPENTVGALYALPKQKVYAVETDYRKTSDGEFVIIHDATVDRTTNGTGLVSSFTFNAIRELDAGSWYTGAIDFNGEKLPTIGEYVRAAVRRGVQYILLQPYGQESAADALKAIEEVKAVGCIANVIFMANNPEQAMQIRSIDPYGVLIGIFGTTVGGVNSRIRIAKGVDACLLLTSPGDQQYLDNKDALPIIKEAGIIPGASTLNFAWRIEDAADNSDACFVLTDFINSALQYERG